MQRLRARGADALARRGPSSWRALTMRCAAYVARVSSEVPIHVQGGFRRGLAAARRYATGGARRAMMSDVLWTAGALGLADRVYEEG